MSLRATRYVAPLREGGSLPGLVEAEDEGTVKEILCEEGQAVNEGDTLVVLE